MAFVPVPLTVEAAFKGKCEGQDVVNTLCFLLTAGTLDIAAINSLAALIRPWYHDGPMQSLANTYTYVGLSIRDLSVAGGLLAVYTAGAGDPGGRPFGNLPTKDAFHLNFRTARGGRSYRGGNYVGPIPSGDAAASSVLSSWATNIRSSYANLLTVLSGSGWEWVVVSRQNGGVRRTTGVSTPVESVDYFDLVIDSAGRRKLGHGS